MSRDDEPESPREALAWGLIALCRASFEKELAAELGGVARDLGMEGFVRARDGTAYAVCASHEGVSLDEVLEHCGWQSLVFARSLMTWIARVDGLPEAD